MSWQPPSSPYLLNQVALSNAVRRLWVDNNQWLRALVYSILFNIGDRAAIEARLGQTAQGFGDLFGEFYGPEAAEKIRANYLEYVGALEVMIEAYRDNNVAVISEQRDVLYRISDELAQFYAQINRYLDRSTLQIMLYELVNETENGIAHITTGDFTQEIQAYDQWMEQGYRVSDELTTGILRQFRI